MRGLTRVLAGVTLLVSGCSADLGVEVVDANGNPTVVTVNSETIERSEAAAEGTRGSDVGATAEPTPTGDVAGEATPETVAGERAEPDATATPDGEGTPAPTTPPTATPVPAGEATPTPSATSEATPTPTPTPAPTATSTPTPEPTATPTPTPTPTPVPIEFVVSPNAALLGVDIGTDATDALTSLEDAIGTPDFDSGWYVGCPLDGDELDERLVQWGDLNVYFDRSDGDEIMRAWGYDLRIVDGGFPEIELIELPGGGQMGDPVNEVAAAAELEVRYDVLFDINRVGEDGYEILSDAPPGAPVWGVFIPAIPTCE